MTIPKPDLLIIGAGLAGCEAAAAAARQGLRVTLADRKPASFSPAHTMPGPAELVCSNSLGSRDVRTSSGLLKEEMRRLGSILMVAAEKTSVPAGGTLAVDRTRFSAETEQSLADLGLRVECREIEELPDEPCVVATGPLTSDALSASLAAAIGSESLFFFDATSPIVAADSIDEEKIYRKSRWEKGPPDYINCPMTREEYAAFLDALLRAEAVQPHGFEDARLFSACMPVEDMARKGEKTLLFGPLRPVGLDDPKTGKRPFAVVQLRREDVAGEAYSLVGFQTKLRHPDQVRVFRMIPGLEHAEFLRLGVIHRNTYVEGPKVLDAALALRARPHVRLAGQITGVEGYVESAACGLLAGLFAVGAIRGIPIGPPPETTMLGALHRHVTASASTPFVPMNANFGLLPPAVTHARAGREERRGAKADRALSDLDRWISELSGSVFR